MNFSVEEKFDLYVPYFRPPPHDGTDNGRPAGHGYGNAAVWNGTIARDWSA